MQQVSCGQVPVDTTTQEACGLYLSVALLPHWSWAATTTAFGWRIQCSYLIYTVDKKRWLSLAREKWAVPPRHVLRLRPKVPILASSPGHSRGRFVQAPPAICAQSLQPSFPCRLFFYNRAAAGLPGERGRLLLPGVQQGRLSQQLQGQPHSHTRRASQQGHSGRRCRRRGARSRVCARAVGGSKRLTLTFLVRVPFACCNPKPLR